MIVKYSDMILLEHRRDSDKRAIIGGGLKTDEAIEGCAKRGLLEETVIELSNQSLELFRIYNDPTRIARYLDTFLYRVCKE